MCGGGGGGHVSVAVCVAVAVAVCGALMGLGGWVVEAIETVAFFFVVVVVVICISELTIIRPVFCKAVLLL